MNHNKIQKTEKFYEHFSQDKPTKAGKWIAKKISQKIFDACCPVTGSRILEIGPGRGVFADICLNNGIEYYAIEPNEYMANDLMQKGANVTMQLVPPLPDTNQKFDYIVMINFIEHVDTMQAALQILSVGREQLNPNGKVVIYSPDYINWTKSFFFVDFSHNYITTMRRIESLFISCGFKKDKGVYINAFFSGITAVISSSLAVLMPLYFLEILFPKSQFIKKIYKLQRSFFRYFLIIGQKQ